MRVSPGIQQVVVFVVWIGSSSKKPDLVILGLGANDGMRGLALEEIEKKNLTAMIDICTQKNVDVLLLGYPYPKQCEQHTTDFANIYPKLAKEHSVPFVPSFGGSRGSCEQSSGWNSPHKRMKMLANNILPSLQQWRESQQKK